jgi:hypothetical protein
MSVKDFGIRLCLQNGRILEILEQIPSGIKSEISYTPEDGLVGRNM